MIPKLSIAIPNYNYASYLPQAIESVINQDYKDYELLIIDDASTDGSQEIINQYTAKDSRIRPFLLPKNRSLFGVIEVALQEARGDYFHFLSSDDYLAPHFLSKLMIPLLANPTIGVACCDIEYFDAIDPKKRRIIRSLPNTLKPLILNKEEVIQTCRTTPFCVAGISCIVKRGLHEKYGGFHKSLENLSDWFLFNQMALFEGIVYIPEVLYAIREHQMSYTQQVKTNSKRRKATYWALLEILSRKENREVRKRFKRSTLLTFVFENLFWRLLFYPPYWDFFPHISLKFSFLKRIKRSIKKRILN